MVCKINDAEQSQLVAELRQRIAELEISNQEYHTTNEIANKAVQPTSPIENGGRTEEVRLHHFVYVYRGCQDGAVGRGLDCQSCG